MPDPTPTYRLFPIQTQRDARPHPLRIPWSIAELAYSVYAGKYGRDQSLSRLAERGGFGPNEMDIFLPDWRERCSETAALRAEADRLRAERDAALQLKAEHTGMEECIDDLHDMLTAAGIPEQLPSEHGAGIRLRVMQLIRERDAARAVNKEVEWCHGNACPSCWQLKSRGHVPDCRLAANLPGVGGK